jgi:hypothetical protein
MFRRIIVCGAALAGSSIAATAQTCPLPAVAASVELRSVPGSDLMTVPVAINGISKQFLLDVSANPTEVSQALVAELKLPENTQATDSTQFAQQIAPTGSASPEQINTMSAPVYQVDGARGREVARPRIRVATFTLGTATGNNQQFVVSNDADLGKSKPYDGRLTGSFFKQYDIELDFGGKMIHYLTPNKCTDMNQVVYWPHAAVAAVPMTMFDGKMQVSVSIEGHDINALIDTGSERTVMRREVAERLFGLKADTPDMMPSGNLQDGRGQKVYDHTFKQISFEGVAALNVPALIQSNSMIRRVQKEPVLGSRAQFVGEPRIADLTLGMDVLRRLHMYVVYGQEKIYMTAAGPGQNSTD